MDNLEEMDKFLERYNFLRLNQEELEKKGRRLKSIVRSEKGEVPTDSAEIQSILRDYYKQRYANKMDNLEEMDKFLEKHNLLRLNQEEIENINRPVTSTETDTVIKIFQKTKA